MQAIMTTEEVESLDPAMIIPRVKFFIEDYNNQIPAMLYVTSNVTAVRNCVPALSLVELGKKLLLSAKAGDTDQVRLLISKGAPFATDWLGTSPLHVAAQYGHVSTAEVLLRAGISRDARTKVERTPLHIAAQEGNTPIVQLLLSHGADVDSKDMLRMTPLHWAVEREHVDTVELLLQHGANPHEVSKFDKSAYDIALDNNRHDIIQLLNSVAEQIPSLQTVAGSAAQQAMEEATLAATQKTITTSPPSTTEKRENFISSTKKQTFRNKIVTNSENRKDGSRRWHEQCISEFNDSALSKRNIDVCHFGNTACSHMIEAMMPQNVFSSSATLQLLQAHGITMLPADDTTLVASAVESGHTVVLT
ncbi:hypothetical protein L9F63_004845, partial [Diploptera punctata]